VITLAGDVELETALTEIESAYGETIEVGNRKCSGFWRSRAGRTAADGQVVAAGKVRGYTVVSNDQAILLACMVEDIASITWTEFARRLGLNASDRQSTLQFGPGP
jgi:hypothetical protein